MNAIDTILHIGMGKAGSSTIQKFFSGRRDTLQDQGIIYPYDIIQGNRLGGDNHKCLAINCIEYDKNHIVFKQQKVRSKKDKAGFEKHVMNSYLKQIEAASPSSICILSAEHFWSVLTTKDLILKLKATLESIGFKIKKIVVYIRDQIQWLKSFTQQKLTEGSSTSLDLPFKSKQAISSRLDYFEMLQLWESCFPEAVMIPRLFERSAFHKNNLILDFLSACSQLHISKNFTEADFIQQQNASNLTLEGYLLLAKFNEYEQRSKRKALNDFGTYTANRKFLMNYLRKNFKGKCDTFFSKSDVIELKNMFKISNSKTREIYFPERSELFESDSGASNSLSSDTEALQLNVVKHLYELVVSQKK